MAYRIEVSLQHPDHDARAHALRKKLKNHLGVDIKIIETRDVYILDIPLSWSEVDAIAQEITNPITHRYRINQSDANSDWVVMVGYRPGVTDNIARTLAQVISNLVKRPIQQGEGVYSYVEYLFSDEKLSEKTVTRLAYQLLGNPLIHAIYIYNREKVQNGELPVHIPRIGEDCPIRVERINLEVSDEELLDISRRGILALSLEEMKAIQAYYRKHGKDPQRIQLGLGAEPTDVELECIAQSWSEHCSHKIFSAEIEYEDKETGEKIRIDGLFRTYIRAATERIAKEVSWLRSVFKDNAGVIQFNEKYDLVYKVETHNSPSALDPYGGAMTGIVGVNRDPLGTGKGAQLLANVWGYCFASPEMPYESIPEGLLHPRIIRDGVHQGVIEGGNQSGIPYALGWEYFDERFLGKPLVFCGTVGILPKECHGEPGYQKEIRPGDLIVMAGGRIGKDGIHGATFSSEALHSESPAQAVQIGDPITQKKLYDFTIEARDRGLFRFITDNGAGGLSSSIGEMARECGGAKVDLAKAPLKYKGLQPWEILVSEAQERMSYAVPPDKIEEFLTLAKQRDVEATVLGEFTNTGKFHVLYGNQTVAYLDINFIHGGCPKMKLKAQWIPPQHSEPVIEDKSGRDLAKKILDLMNRLNICSGERKARQYDHEVKGLSVIKPYVGVMRNVPADATVMMVEQLSQEGIVLSYGVYPRYSDLDTYHMVTGAVDTAVRRAIGTGADPYHLAGLDNFCWPDPILSEQTPDGLYKLAQLVRANQALYDITTAYRVPCISGKDSMKNDSIRGGKKISIPPTLLFSTIGRIEDISLARTLVPLRGGDDLYIVGMTFDELGGSEYYATLGYIGTNVPKVRIEQAWPLYLQLAKVLRARICHSVHTPTLGGLAVGLAKKVIAGGLGLKVDLDKIPCANTYSPETILFSESHSRFLITIHPDNRKKFEEYFRGFPYAKIGEVIYEPSLCLYYQGELLAKNDLESLTQAFKSRLDYD